MLRNGRAEFLGYHRADGQVGTRNYWLVVPLVFCENRNIGVLKQAFEEELGFAAPQIYRRQVAELARLYQEGRKEEFRAACADPEPAAGATIQDFRERGWNPSFCCTKADAVERAKIRTICAD